MHITTVAGPGADRGRDHGRELATQIAEAAAALKTHLAARGHPPGPLARRLSTSPLTRTAAELTPDLWAEVTAIAAAGRAPLEDVLLLTFLDEVWALTAGCSVIARTVSGRPGEPPTPATTEIGQTMDLPAWTVGRMRVLRVGPDVGPTALLMAYPGSIGLCGANEAGVGVAVNALTHAPSREDGLAVAFVTRHLLTLTSAAEAEAFLAAVPHASGQAYTIAAPDGLAAFEADADGVRRVTYPGVPAIAHTNHPLAGGRAAPTATESSRERLLALTSGLERHAALAGVLADDVAVDGERWDDPFLTFGAFRAVGSEPHARFIDGVDIRAGRRDWARVAFR